MRQPPSKKPACFSSGSFNFQLLFFSSAALLTPSPLRKFVSDKKVVAGCLAFENSSLGRRLLCCKHLFAAIGALLRTTAFSVWTLKNISKSGINIFPRQKDSNLFITSLKSGLRWGLNHNNESSLCYGCLCVVIVWKITQHRLYKQERGGGGKLPHLAYGN